MLQLVTIPQTRLLLLTLLVIELLCPLLPIIHHSTNVWHNYKAHTVHTLHTVHTVHTEIEAFSCGFTLWHIWQVDDRLVDFISLSFFTDCCNDWLPFPPPLPPPPPPPRPPPLLSAIVQVSPVAWISLSDDDINITWPLLVQWAFIAAQFPEIGFSRVCCYLNATLGRKNLKNPPIKTHRKFPYVPLRFWH